MKLTFTMHWLYVIGLILGCAMPPRIAAAATRSLTIAEAIEWGRVHSPMARRLELEERGALLAGRAAARRSWPDLALEIEAPSLSQEFAVEPLPGASVDTVRTPQGETILVTQQVFGKTTTTRRNASGALRYRHLLPWRGSLRGDGSVFVRDEETTPRGIRSGRRDTHLQAGIGLELPLLGRDDERATLRRALHAASAARARVRQSEAQWIFDCTSRYLALMRARFAFEVETSAAAGATAALELAEQKVRAGLLPDVDRMRIAVHRAERDARLAESAAEFGRSADEFKVFLGIPLSDSLLLTESLLPDVEEVDAATAVGAALQQRAEIGIAAGEIDLLEADRRAHRPYRPDVGLSARYGGSASDRSFDTALQELTANSLSLALRLQFPLWDAGRGAVSDAEARNEIALKRLDLEVLRSQVELEVRDAVRRMQDAARRVRLLEASAQWSDEQLRINAERYDRGLLDTTGYLASQAEAEAARIGRMSALLDLYQARARLRLLTLERGS